VLLQGQCLVSHMAPCPLKGLWSAGFWHDCSISILHLCCAILRLPAAPVFWAMTAARLFWKRPTPGGHLRQESVNRSLLSPSASSALSVCCHMLYCLFAGLY
jgi:hypothetical protein